MPHDPVRVSETSAWFTKAASDLRAAEYERTAVPPLSGDIAFHSEQAVEKALKGFLVWHDVPFRKTHDLAELGQQCVLIDPSLEPLLVRAEVLTVYAWVFRYPGEPTEPPLSEAEDALGVAREVYERMLALLPSEVRPSNDQPGSYGRPTLA